MVAADLLAAAHPAPDLTQTNPNTTTIMRHLCFLFLLEYRQVPFALGKQRELRHKTAGRSLTTTPE